MNLKEREIKLKRPNNKYMRAYVKAVEQGYSRLHKQQMANKNSQKKST